MLLFVRTDLGNEARQLATELPARSGKCLLNIGEKSFLKLPLFTSALNDSTKFAGEQKSDVHLVGVRVLLRDRVPRGVLGFRPTAGDEPAEIR